MKEIIACFVMVFCMLMQGWSQPAMQAAGGRVSLSSVLSQLYDVSLLPQYQHHTVSAQVSSYDPAGGNDDGFSGSHSFIRRNADSSLVLLELKGPGVINRIWTPTPTGDTLDFYLDGGARQPALSIAYHDLFSGKRFPFTAPLCGNDLGGFYCYFPILFNNGCTVVCRGKKMQFHQLQYRLYPAGTIVETYTEGSPAAHTQQLKTIDYVWNSKLHNFSSIRLLHRSGTAPNIKKQLLLMPGETATIFSTARGGTVEGIEISPAAAFEDLYKTIDIEIVWDDDKVPAVYCPLADFFGYAFGQAAMQGALIGNVENRNYCWLPMPFDKKAVIKLHYRQPTAVTDAQPLAVNTTVYYSHKKRRPGSEGRLYTCWNRLTTNGQPHVFLNTAARGHYIGSILQAQGKQAGMTYFFEGDDSTVIDGQLRLHGTGSEDYFNGGWYALSDRWDGKLGLALHGCMDYSLPFCRTAAYRFYLSDKLSFENSFFHSIEHGPAGNQVPVDYTSLAFYYADRAPASFTRPVDELSKVWIPDTLIMYPQLMNAVVDGGFTIATAWKYNTGGLSYAYTATENAMLKISIAELPPGNYELLLDVVRDSAGAGFSVWQGQHNLSGWISSAAATDTVVRNWPVAAIARTDARKTITLQISGGGNKNRLILNRLIFIKQP
jgi:Protein of unknown function (DUF2961)